jgi:hypothetical protein
VPRDPRRRGERRPAAADRGGPGGGPGGALPGAPLPGISPRARLLPVLLPQRGDGPGVRGGRRRAAAVRGPGRRLRPRPGRGHQPAQPGDRGPRLLGGTGRGGAPGGRLRGGAAGPRHPSRGETFPGARGHFRGLPRGAPRRPGGQENAPRAGAAPVPQGHPRGDPRDHDRPRAVPRPRPVPPRDAFREDPQGTASGDAAVPGDGLLRRAGDEGDLEGARHGRGGGACGIRGVRRGARLPGGGPPGGGDRPDRPGRPRRRYVSSGAGGGGAAVGASPGVGGVEGTLSTEPDGAGVGAAPGAGGASLGAVGRYRATISGR